MGDTSRHAGGHSQAIGRLARRIATWGGRQERKPVLCAREGGHFGPLCLESPPCTPPAHGRADAHARTGGPRLRPRPRLLPPQPSPPPAPMCAKSTFLIPSGSDERRPTPRLQRRFHNDVESDPRCGPPGRPPREASGTDRPRPARSPAIQALRAPGAWTSTKTS